MQERPILMCGDMVRATLEDRKTNTRRVVKPQPVPDPIAPERLLMWNSSSMTKDGAFTKYSPYGQPGDRLWVREAWRPLWDDADKPGGLGDCVQYRADMSKRKPLLKDIGFDDGMKFDEMCDESCPEPRWRPSIHMPRWARRITLEVTGIRVERVQDISVADCIAEGIAPVRKLCPGFNGYEHGEIIDFRCLWDSINAARGYGWKVNPWVWVISFRRVTPRTTTSLASL